MGTLSDRVMATMPDSFEESDDYYRGFAMGTAKSSTIAKEADELMDRMLAALEDCAREDADRLDAAMAKDTVEMYYK